MEKANPFAFGPADHCPPASQRQDRRIQKDLLDEQQSIDRSQSNCDGLISRWFGERYEIEAQVAREAGLLSEIERRKLEGRHKALGGEIQKLLDQKEVARKREESLDDYARTHRDSVRAIDRARDDQVRQACREGLEGSVERWKQYQDTRHALASAVGERERVGEKGTLVAAA
ncbi:MAG: hypothetical protein MJD61_14850 [Proteobacteria bacterium]|nr:hypothetical protein [Pseudomonadota bacterium]